MLPICQHRRRGIGIEQQPLRQFGDAGPRSDRRPGGPEPQRPRSLAAAEWNSALAWRAVTDMPI